MKRDLDLIRKILLEIESWPAGIHNQGVVIEGYSHEDITHNAMLLHDAGYIEAIVSRTTTGNSIYPRKLTWEGYEFLDEARDKTVWKKAKKATEQVGTTSLAIFRTILTRVASSELEQVLNRLNG